MASRSWKRQENGFSPRASRKESDCQYPDYVWHNLQQQQHETNTVCYYTVYYNHLFSLSFRLINLMVSRLLRWGSMWKVKTWAFQSNFLSSNPSSVLISVWPQCSLISHNLSFHVGKMEIIVRTSQAFFFPLRDEVKCVCMYSHRRQNLYHLSCQGSLLISTLVYDN